jgi:hypothetical protein
MTIWRSTWYAIDTSSRYNVLANGNDCYEVFTKMVNRGDFPEDIYELISTSD